jgi:HD superfamily phosphodiesterase
MSTFFSKLIQYVLLTTAKHSIDESHGLGHSLNVLHYANRIYESELPTNPQLYDQKNVIFIAAALHDMCDKKYMQTDKALVDIRDYLVQENVETGDEELEAIERIMQTMSYSAVKLAGFPQMDEYQHAYHIVRESDLLSAYDFDRSMLYHMHRGGCSIEDAFSNAEELFRTRVFKHRDDGLLLTDFSLRESFQLERVALERMLRWRNILRIPV